MTTTRRNFRPGPLQQVELAADGQRWALTFARDFPQSADAIWNALTDPAEQAHWAPYRSDRVLDSVGPAVLTMIGGPESTDVDGTVRNVDRPNFLEHAWGVDTLQWTLSKSDIGTRLTLVQTIADRKYAAMTAAGWHICLDVAAEVASGSHLGAIVGADAFDHGWRALNEQYSAVLDLDVVEPPL